MAYAIGVILFALGILVSIALHEYGHFGTARAFGMKVTRYFIGFGPTLWSFHRKGVEYGLKWIPAGAFVKIVGMTPQEDDVKPEDQHRAMWRFPVWKRTIVLGAGSGVHFLLGFLILWALFAFAPINDFDRLDTAPATVSGVAECVQLEWEVDPTTGAVLAYYGGDDGTGVDLAGINEDPDLQSGRPPGSTAKIYTLIAAMREGVSFDTHWQTEPFTPPWRDIPIRNAGRPTAGSCEGTAPDYCTLRWSTIQSYNVPFAYFSMAKGGDGPAAIVQAAMDAGVRTMSSPSCAQPSEEGEADSFPRSGNAIDLTSIEAVSEVAPNCFFHEVAFGQYEITVLDHASGMATLAARGVYHEPHFVAKVEEKDENGDWVAIYSNSISGDQRIQTEHADAITGVLGQIPSDPIMGGKALANGRPAAAKTGTWEYDGPGGGNADAWVVGYTPQIAAAVWTGDPDGGPIKDVFGGNIGSSGLPADIWKAFMDAAHEVKGFEQQQFPPAPQVGNPQHPFANGIEPQPEDEEDTACRGFIRPRFCDDDGDNNGGDNGDNGGNENDGNNNNGGGGLQPQPPGLLPGVPGDGDNGG
jgi:membrane peptidoglycan carboxypeptidase